MKVTKPEDLHTTYVEAFNSGHIEDVLNLYEPGAAFVPEPGAVLTGLAAIGEAIKQFQGIGTMSAHTRYCIESGDVALASAAWRIKGVDPDGEPVEANGQSADLFRRQSDGSWLLVVDNPFGAT